MQLRTIVLARGGPPACVDEINAVVYLSVPVSNRTPAMYRTFALWASEIEEELELLGVQHGLNLFLHVLGLGQRDENELRSSARLGLRDAVLHLVLGAHGGTSGVGRELQASIARRRPVGWFVPPGERAPQSVRAAVPEADITILPFSDVKQLRAGVRSVVSQKLTKMLEMLTERGSIPGGITAMQDELRSRWARCDTDAVLARARVTPDRAKLLLMDPFAVYHETTLSEFHAFASALGVDIFDRAGTGPAASRSSKIVRPANGMGAAIDLALA